MIPKASKAKRSGEENRRRSYDQMPVNPAFVPLPKVDVREVEQLNMTGSEDLIIPDSDGETDDIFEAGDGAGSSGGGRMGLGRFLCS